MKKRIAFLLTTTAIAFLCYRFVDVPGIVTGKSVGDPVDSLNNVVVYYNGKIGNVEGRNTDNGYNIGLKYQCVEFVKRYYYEHLNHKMPDSYGHAVSFYSKDLADGTMNTQRNLMQHANPSKTKPKVSDLMIMDATMGNPYGHVVIVSEVSDTELEYIQQNPGISAPSRVRVSLSKNEDNHWSIDHARILGWLRK